MQCSTALYAIACFMWRLQAFRRRGESFRKMLSFPGMQYVMNTFTAVPYCTIDIISDYVMSSRLQETPDPKSYYEAIVMAVDEG